MKVSLLRVGKGRTPWADEAVEDYARRLPRQLPYKERLLKPEAFRGDVEAVRSAEGERILGAVKSADRLVALDERGERPTTEEFVGWLKEAQRGGSGSLVFAIGGPYWHAEAVRQRSWRVLALSSLVVNHELARVLLVEQLYRASTLMWGGSYHH